MIQKVFVLLTLFIAASSHAQTIWKLDKSHSNVDFTVEYLVLSQVRGSFDDVDATITSFSPDFSDMRIEATIKTASIYTDNERRDNHLRSNDFLNAEKYPNITFKSTSVKETGDRTYEVRGDLTIRDITKPVVLATTYKGSIEARGSTRAAFRATASIDRFEFGTTWDKTIETGALVVGKHVEIELLLTFVKDKNESQGTR